jgi:hypothetical protein
MSEARPAQRRSPVRVFTRAGWIEGKLHVPESMPLLDFLNSKNTFFNLTDVRIGGDTKLKFLALSRAGIVFVEPTNEEKIEAMLRTSTRTKLRQVSCLFDGGMVMGTLAIGAEHRVSDDLMASQDFVLLGNCTVGVDDHGAPGQPKMESVSSLLFQTTHLVAVAEMG